MSDERSVLHHYVPRWYQYLFIPEGKRELKYNYLDLTPVREAKPHGGYFYRKQLRPLGPASCFAEDDLYTLKFGATLSDVMERKFFGRIDADACEAVPFMSDYNMHDFEPRKVHNFVDFLSVQKFRTPKGLDYLKIASKAETHQKVLYKMQQLWQINKTIWMEGVWEVLQCDSKGTKFIVTDHPVVTYNRSAFPQSRMCLYPRDAPIELLGTHTIFPLGPTRILVITNLGYARNPKVNRLEPKENARYFETTMFDGTAVQTGRVLSESEVIAVNFILKKRAKRYIAAPEQEWLYPEKQMKTQMWDRLGNEFFLMPDARKMKFTTNILMGYENGSAWGMDEYGRAPRRGDPMQIERREKEWTSFNNQKKKWEARFGELSLEERKKNWW